MPFPGRHRSCSTLGRDDHERKARARPAARPDARDAGARRGRDRLPRRGVERRQRQRGLDRDQRAGRHREGRRDGRPHQRPPLHRDHRRAGRLHAPPAAVTGTAGPPPTAALALRPVVCSAVSDTGYASATATSGQAIVYWAGASNVTVLRKTSAFGSERPADGVAYVGGAPVGAASVVYSGSAATFTQTGLTNGPAYHYKVFVRDGTPCYSTGTEVKAGPVAGASPAWSYSMAGGSMLNPGITGYGTIYTSSNAGRIVSLSTADGTQSWTPVGAAAAVQGTPTWVPAGGLGGPPH